MCAAGGAAAGGASSSGRSHDEADVAAAVARSLFGVLGRVEGAFDEAEVASWCGATEVRRQVSPVSWRLRWLWRDGPWWPALLTRPF